jgi:TRAP-type C4-dicarboxylate transport system permease small subunit
MQTQTAGRFRLRNLHLSLIEGVVLVTYSAVAVLTVLQVLSRYVIGHSLPWTEEMARYCFMWLIYVGMVLGLNRGSHASVDILRDRFPGRAARLLRCAVHTLSVALFAVLLYHGILLLSMVSGQNSPAMRISILIPYASLPTGCALMIIEELWLLRESAQDGKGDRT